MHIILTPLLALVTSVLASTGPYPYPNSTNTSYPHLIGPTAFSNPTFPPVSLPCKTFYPTKIRILNSRYPSYSDPLYNRNNLIMLLRQHARAFQIVTQIQFSLPSTYQAETEIPVPPINTTNATNICHLHLYLPTDAMQTISGPQPVFNMYQVASAANDSAAWESYVAKNISEDEPRVFGQVNGTAKARARVWAEKQGVLDIGPTLCNQTLTWQLGMVFDGGDEVNYWDFLEAGPPAWPQQGFRVVVGAGC